MINMKSVWAFDNRVLIEKKQTTDLTLHTIQILILMVSEVRVQLFS